MKMLRLRFRPSSNAIKQAMEFAGLAALVGFCFFVWQPLALLAVGVTLIVLAQGVRHDAAQ